MTSVRQSIATREGKRRYVRALFDTIADRYDWITVVLSGGRDRQWKRRVIKLAAPVAGELALDLAAGTGDLAYGLAAHGAHVVGLDLSPRMLVLARARATVPPAEWRGGPPRFVLGDMLTLPFETGVFDLVTTGYGLRNVIDLERALAEIVRVLKPGGRLVSLDFNRPANRLVRGAYLAYLDAVGATLGWALHRDPDTYRYIPASIRGYSGGETVARLMIRAGFSNAAYHPVLGGLMAIHQAVMPPR